MTQEQLMKAMQDSLAEINTILKKSDHPEAESEMLEEQASAEIPQEESSPEASSEDPMAPEAPAPEEPQEEDLAAMAQSMSDEELQMMLEILQSELASRQTEAPAAPEASAPDALAMSMKEDMSKMAKSIEALANVVGTLAKSQAAAPARPQTVSRPATTNRPVVVNKTPEAPKSSKLSKSETSNFLLGELKKGNKAVTSEMVAAVAYVKEDELPAFHESLRAEGINVPQ